MSVQVDVQRAVSSWRRPLSRDLRGWARHALQRVGARGSVVLYLVDRAEMVELNRRYRDKDGPTNVLSFAYQPLPGSPQPCLGDVVLCRPVIDAEARDQGKAVAAHWAHLVIHGCLHLVGYDHEMCDDATRMEALETQLLAELGLPDPYLEPVPA